MPGCRAAAALLQVLAILLLSQGALRALAKDPAPAEKQEATGMPAKNVDWDPITKLLAWIQQNDGQVRATGLPMACSISAWLVSCEHSFRQT